jgi:predicted nucleotidyltransferase component of viral defense system
MPGIFWHTVSHGMRRIMSGFSQTDIGKRFYLAGGTALALQLGHRRSVALDYFSPTEDIPSIKESLRQSLGGFAPILADSAWGNLVFIAEGIRNGFYRYGYDLVEPLIDIDGIRLASVADIALMKLDALLARARRKDFYDLYVICQRRPLLG